MRRRNFIVLLGGAAVAWPLAARAQQPATPVIGFLSAPSPEDSTHLIPAFAAGLAEGGYVESQNLATEFRWARGRYVLLPAMAAELVSHRVAVLTTAGGEPSALAAKRATSTARLAQKPVDALLVGPAVLFNIRRVQLVTLATYDRVPAIYTLREASEAGGLMSYGTNFTPAYRQAGIYTGRVLKGEKPADLPVVQSTKFEFVIKLNTAKAFGLSFPPGLLAIADEVIE